MLLVFLIFFVTIIAADDKEKVTPYCVTASDCVKLIGAECNEAGVTCGCESQSWCSLKRFETNPGRAEDTPTLDTTLHELKILECDPTKNGGDCPEHLPSCIVEADKKHYCGRHLSPMPLFSGGV
ncbi:unnamed protein product, partial [Mesorhabditis belari]|uniref:Uncharacterized protein n=1 Tax=Mesorhabditis belari TaxID=2138241 RepID=A0AAF3EDX5_9BILA